MTDLSASIWSNRRRVVLASTASYAIDVLGGSWQAFSTLGGLKCIQMPRPVYETATQYPRTGRRSYV